MKKALALLLVFASLSIVLVSCSGGDVVGTWEYKDPETGITVSFVFEEDGKGYSEAMGIKGAEFEWETKGDKLTMTMDGEKYESEYEVDGDQLKFTDPDGTKLTLTKKD